MLFDEGVEAGQTAYAGSAGRNGCADIGRRDVSMRRLNDVQSAWRSRECRHDFNDALSRIPARRHDEATAGKQLLDEWP
jgi:hypothetical protein